MQSTTQHIKQILVTALIRYDAKESTKKSYNRWALPQYLQRLDEICADIDQGIDVRTAIRNGFLGRLCDKCLRALDLPPTTKEERDAPRRLCYVRLGN
jgi:hypothetical protein